MKEVTIKVPEGKSAEWQEVNGVQTLVLVDEKAGYLLDDWYETSTESDDDLNAYLKLRIIIYALNEGWEPKFTIGEYRWFPWYWLKTKEEIEALDEEEKQRAVWRSGAFAVAYSGLVCANADYASTSSHALGCARLAFKSEELANYAGVQFREIYADFCFRSE